MSACLNWFFSENTQVPDMDIIFCFRMAASSDSLVDFVKNTEEDEESTSFNRRHQELVRKLQSKKQTGAVRPRVTTKVTVARKSRKPGQDNKVQVKNTFFTFTEIVSRLQSEHRKQAVTGKIRSQVAAKVGLLSEKFKGLAGKIQGFFDDIKQLEINCVRNLVRRKFTNGSFITQLLL